MADGLKQEQGKRIHNETMASGFTFIDLFAGIGGIRRGFEAAGGECVFTSEWDKFAQESYKANFPHDTHEIAGDIREVKSGDIPDFDVLLGGFPCQPFSLAGVSKKNSLGRDHGFLDKTQGTLFFDVARIIDDKQPRAFLLENVRNLVSHDKGRTFEIVLETLREMDYDVKYKVVSAETLVPQKRKRILIAGFKSGSDFSWDEVDLGEERPTMRSVLHSFAKSEPQSDLNRFVDESGDVQEKYILSDHLWKYLQDYAEKHRKAGNGFGYGLVGPDDVARTLSARYHKDGAEILISRGEGNNPRRLTPREAARLMGFPEDYKIVVSDTQAYRQFGNSVVVPLMVKVAHSMSTHL